jgi:hypothetical protein
MSSSGMLRCMALVRTDVPEERSASIIRVIRMGGERGAEEEGDTCCLGPLGGAIPIHLRTCLSFLT